MERAHQIISEGTAVSEIVWPAHLKFCVDPEYLKSRLTLGFIDGVDDYQDLSDASVTNVLDLQAKEEMDTVTMEDIVKILE